MRDHIRRLFSNLDRDGFNLSAPLRWSYILSGVRRDDVTRTMVELEAMGFTGPEPAFEDEDPESVLLQAWEQTVHTPATLETRVRSLEEYCASREGLELADWSATN